MVPIPHTTLDPSCDKVTQAAVTPSWRCDPDGTDETTQSGRYRRGEATWLAARRSRWGLATYWPDSGFEAPNDGLGITERHTSRLLVHGDAADKAALYRDRYQVLQRLARDKYFSKPAFDTVMTEDDNCEVAVRKIPRPVWSYFNSQHHPFFDDPL
ncbi:hypothetical protein E2562_028786 [Oryza meyeriana var. granulata]|uniref:Uncharacterized protein n=1 Tax=Oryza meyeriana var. granulata TaxID=110450 RepID=A0A6G1EE22_9ORYZ|nr:hypothetical protein E2562_028786 [Oryza meyeriana var. granulata]